MPLGFICLKKIYVFTEYKFCITGDSGKEFDRLRRFLFCFLFIYFSKHPFYFHCALKRMQENSCSGIKRERRFLELQSLANPFSVKICVLFCVVTKRKKEKNCLSIVHHEASQKDLWLQKLRAPHCRLIPFASSLTDHKLREWLCPHGNCPWFGDQELPWEEYLISLSHTCGVSNLSAEMYFGHILTTQSQQHRTRSPPVGINEEISLVTVGYKSYWFHLARCATKFGVPRDCGVSKSNPHCTL